MDQWLSTSRLARHTSGKENCAHGLSFHSSFPISRCSCGRSKNQPFCDGSHEGTSFEPLVWTAEKTEKKFFCACKATEKAPFCDGSHAKEPVIKRYNKQLLVANSQLRDEVAELRKQLADLKA